MADPLTVPRTSGTEGPDLLPLAPFLASLASDGIRPTLREYERIHMVLRTRGSWTVGRLRSVLLALLVRDPDQGLVFRRRFDAFFTLAAERQMAFSQVDLERALADLRVLEREPEITQGQETVLPRLVKTKRHRHWSAVANWDLRVLFVIITFGLLIWRLAASTAEPPATIRPPDSAARPSAAEPTGNSTSDAYLRTIGPAAVSAILLLVALSLSWFRRRQLLQTYNASPHDEQPRNHLQHPLFAPNSPRLYRAGKVGGDPASRLDREVLDRLADLLGYFRSETAGNALDVTRSIEATGLHGGIPYLVFEFRKRVRSVVILEDSLAEPGRWNPIAGELAAGLGQRGVPVVHGRFRGVPERFRTDDGCEHEIEDLEDARRGYLLLVFSAGKGLHHHRDSFALEALRRWPMVAWMELRERRAWDKSTALLVDLGLPVYPASREGLLEVLRRFASERSSREDFSRGRETWCGVAPGGSGARLEEHDLERLLGDSLPWAQSCAMMVSPVSLGLADALRRRFHEDLPPERIERLVTLPGVLYNAAGLRFSRHVSELLRDGFLVRTSPDMQRHVPEFLIAELRQAEPEDKESLEYQAWEWRLEQLRLRLDPEPARRRLEELAKGPLRDAIRAELGDTIAPPPEWTNENDGSILVYVPAGTYTMGSDDNRDLGKPIHQIQLSAYRIGKYPVTNAQYGRFLAANPGQQKPEYWNHADFNQAEQPVVGVSWEEANAYCRWAGLALPSEAQWEAAARGTDQRRYPWGNGEPSSRHANFGPARQRTTPVGAYSEGRGPFDTLDQVGNVWEWCADVWDPKAYTGRHGQIDPVSRRGNASWRILRGGSWAVEPGVLGAAYRFRGWVTFRYRYIGFRCVLPVGPEP